MLSYIMSIYDNDYKYVYALTLRNLSYCPDQEVQSQYKIIAEKLLEIYSTIVETYDSIKQNSYSFELVNRKNGKHNIHLHGMMRSTAAIYGRAVKRHLKIPKGIMFYFRPVTKIIAYELYHRKQNLKSVDQLMKHIEQINDLNDISSEDDPECTVKPIYKKLFSPIIFEVQTGNKEDP